MKIIKKILQTITLTTLIFGFSASILTAQPAVASAADCNSGFLGFPAWYRYLTKDPDCSLKSPNDVGGLGKYIWIIGLNIIEIVLVAIAYVASGYILYGGFLFITSRGKPEGAARARMAILDAVVGLIIAFSALAIAQLVVTGLIK